MNQYEITKSRMFQWVIILLILLGGTGTYFYLRSRAAQTTSDNRPSFEAPLINSLDLARGVGGPTFTRADGADRRATVTDFESLIRPVKNGEARFEGARRMENLFTYSEAFDNGVWGKTANVAVTPNVALAPDGTMSADQAVYTSTADENALGQASSIVAASKTFTYSVWVKSASGTSNFRLFLRETSGGSPGGVFRADLTATTAWTRYSITGTYSGAIGTARGTIGSRDTTAPTIYVWGAQMEEVSGQANQNPSEYVSTNMKTTAPYHGANVDGVKYFATQNGNTVTSNIVTEATGTAISDATLHGYFAEGSRTNLILQSEDLSTTWTGAATLSTNSTVAPSGATTADTITDSSAVAYEDKGQNFTVPNDASTYTFSIFVKKTIGGTSPTFGVNMGLSGGTSTSVTPRLNTDTGTGAIPAGDYWKWTASLTNNSSGNTALSVALYPATAANGSFADTVTGTGSAVVWGAQLEQATFSSSYIPTTTVSVTRNADYLDYPESGNISMTAGTVYAEARAAALQRGWVVGYNSMGNLMNKSSASNPSTMETWDGTTSLNTSNTADWTAGVRIGVIWSGSTKKSSMNGGTVASTSYNGNWGSPSTIKVGYLVAGGNFGIYGNVKNVRIWQKALTDTQLQNITSATNAVSLSGTQQSILLNTGESLRADLTSTLDLQAGVGGPTFSRADGADRRATVTDFEGLIRPVKNGEARFEGARRVENLLTYSEDFSNGSWNSAAEGLSIVADNTTAPDGTMSADKLVETADTTLHRRGQSIAASAGSARRFSIYAKAAGRTKARGWSWAGGATTQQTFDLSNGTTSGALNPTMQNVGNGWYRCSFDVPSTNSNTVVFGPVNDTEVSTSPYLGDGTSGIYVWGGQLENTSGQSVQTTGEYVSTNVKTGVPYHGVNVDGVKYFSTKLDGTAILDATLHGYFAEGSRTNLSLYSSAPQSWGYSSNVTITSNSTISPDGTASAATFTANAGAGYHYRDATASTTTASTVVTGSVYVKYNNNPWLFLTFPNDTFVSYYNVQTNTFGNMAAGVTGTSIALPNGWYRIALTQTVSGTSSAIGVGLAQSNGVGSYSATGTEAVYVWGNQIENSASFASSYIPTTTASVTRAGDVLAYPASGNVGEGEFSLSLEMNRKNNGGGSQPNKSPVSIGSYSSNASINFGGYSGTNSTLLGQFSATSLWDLQGTPFSAITYGTSYRIALKMKSDLQTYIGYKDGVQSTDMVSEFAKSSNWAGNPSYIYIASADTSDPNQDITIKNVRIWQKALTDAQLQGVTNTSDAVARSAIQKTTLNVNQNSQSTNSLVGLWSFNGPDISGTTAYDRSGNNNNGTITGATVTEGKVGQALSFRVSNTYVDLGSSTLLNPSNFTISAWVNPRDVSTSYGYIYSSARDCCGTYNGIELRILSNHLNASIWNSTSAAVSSTATIANNSGWVFSTVTYDGSTLKLYVNGTFDNSLSTSLGVGSPASYNATIGGMGMGPSSYEINGDIDEVRIYNRALSASEVANLYSMGH